VRLSGVRGVGSTHLGVDVSRRWTATQADCIATTRCPWCGVGPAQVCHRRGTGGGQRPLARCHYDRWARHRAMRPLLLHDLKLKQAEVRELRAWLRAYGALLTGRTTG
jgi:hypothetical protein